MDKIGETDPSYTEMKRNKNEENMRTLIADGCYGIPPSRCPCGARIIKETSQTEADIGKRYLTCNVFENDGLHIRKSWELAIEEEVIKLRSEFDENSKEGSFGVHQLYINQLRREVENNVAEIASLKELVAKLVGRIEKLFGPLP